MDLIFNAENDNYIKVPLNTLFDVRNQFTDFHEMAFPAEIEGRTIIGSSWDIFDRDYQMNYGDFGLGVDNSQITGLKAGRIYVAY